LLSKDLISFLTLSGFNTYPDEGFIPATLPEAQYPCLFVFASGGYAPHDYLPRDNPTYQVIIKGESYKANPANKTAAEALAKQLIDLLHKKHNLMVGDAYVWSIKAAQSNPIPLGLDEQDRPMYSTNFIFQTKGV
jgi:hypothetical protein